MFNGLACRLLGMISTYSDNTEPNQQKDRKSDGGREDDGSDGEGRSGEPLTAPQDDVDDDWVLLNDDCASEVDVVDASQYDFVDDDDDDDAKSLLSLGYSTTKTPTPSSDWHFYPPACFVATSNDLTSTSSRSASLKRRNPNDDNNTIRASLRSSPSGGESSAAVVVKGKNKYKHAKHSHNLNTSRGINQNIVQRRRLESFQNENDLPMDVSVVRNFLIENPYNSNDAAMSSILKSVEQKTATKKSNAVAASLPLSDSNGNKNQENQHKMEKDLAAPSRVTSCTNPAYVITGVHLIAGKNKNAQFAPACRLVEEKPVVLGQNLHNCKNSNVKIGQAVNKRRKRRQFSLYEPNIVQQQTVENRTGKK